MISRASERVAKGHVVVVAIMARRRGIIFSVITGFFYFCSVLGLFVFFFFGVAVGGEW